MDKLFAPSQQGADTMSIACRPGQRSLSQSLFFSLQSFSWQSELGWASILTDLTYFGKQSKSFAPAVQCLVLSSPLGPLHMCCWVEETRASQKARTHDGGFPKATQEPPHSPLHYQCQQSASCPTSFPYHPFSVSV